ncbi:probable suppressor of mrs2-1 mutation [Cephalotrichum gorgonifer]|uniref:Probable suppressor of mrs2-1 mutation n=1 Tax=Cephalotrichum gorgonifer TaxID=2041049 RepID=A0AAE8N9F9_9PEZI|nr:probable suppressor of mrs2-1 mutation [Cephalotrichum gorgonifer]
MIPSTVARRAIRPVAASHLAGARHARPLPRGLPRHIPALAVLIPLRHISTEHHRSVGSGGPPPGFNAEEAKKPLVQESEKTASKIDSAAAPSSAKEVTGTQEAVSEKQSKTQNEAASDVPAAKPRGELKAEEKDAKKKLTVMQKIKKEAQHYWDGTKLLAAEVKISTRLALKMAAGYELTRREHRQLKRTVVDLGRIVPFSVFIIVPFAELLLPVALKLFPNMLPSTYEGQNSKDKKASVLRATRNDVSQFLRTTLKETGLPVTVSAAQKEEFATFFRKVRTTGEQPSREDVIRVCQLFKDDLTLDNLSRPQLYSMCRYLNLSTFGNDTMLRYQVRHRMRQIKRDDRTIAFEGVDSLNVAELQAACAARGVRTYSVSPARMRADLQTWLDLRLKDKVPSTILVLSNAYMYSGEVTDQIDALTGVLSSIPEELFHEMELEVHNAEGAATNKQRLEVLKEQQELIEEENSQNQVSESGGMVTPRDIEDIDEKEERHMHAEAEADKNGIDKTQVPEMVDAEVEAAKTAKPVEGEEKK